MKISVIVPIYNSERFLRRCLQSIICQSYKNLEIILVNDGSKDSSLSICEEYAKKDNRIIFITKENGGVSSARNAAIEKATGDYITFVDSDDWLNLDVYEKAVSVIEKYEVDIYKFGIVREYGKFQIKNQIKIQSNVVIDACDYKSKVVPYIFTTFDIANVCGVIINKKCIKNIRFEIDLKVGEDTMFIARALINSNSLYINSECGYHYFNNISSMTNVKSLDKCFEYIDNLSIVYPTIYDIFYQKYGIDRGFLIKKLDCILTLYLKKVATDYDYDSCVKIARVFKEKFGEDIGKVNISKYKYFAYKIQCKIKEYIKHII